MRGDCIRGESINHCYIIEKEEDEKLKMTHYANLNAFIDVPAMMADPFVV